MSRAWPSLGVGADAAKRLSGAANALLGRVTVPGGAADMAASGRCERAAASSQGQSGGSRLGGAPPKGPRATMPVAGGHASGVWLIATDAGLGEAEPPAEETRSGFCQFSAGAQSTRGRLEWTAWKLAGAAPGVCHPTGGGGPAAGPWSAGASAGLAAAKLAMDNACAAGRRDSGKRAGAVNGRARRTVRSPVPARGGGNAGTRWAGKFRRDGTGSARGAKPAGLPVSGAGISTARCDRNAAAPLTDRSAGRLA